jgi:hypothetical protein
MTGLGRSQALFSFVPGRNAQPPRKILRCSWISQVNYPVLPGSSRVRRSANYYFCVNRGAGVIVEAGRREALFCGKVPVTDVTKLPVPRESLFAEGWSGVARQVLSGPQNQYPPNWRKVATPTVGGRADEVLGLRKVAVFGVWEMAGTAAFFRRRSREIHTPVGWRSRKPTNERIGQWTRVPGS